MTTTNCSSSSCTKETKFNLPTSAMGLQFNHKVTSSPSWHTTSGASFCFTSTVWASKKVSPKMRFISSNSQSMKLSLNSNFSHSKITSNTTSLVFYGLSFAKHTLMDLHALYTRKPNSLAKFGLTKECVVPISTRHERSLPLIWASRYNRLGFGLRPLALATNPPFNI
jgi:hypothetical protein